MYCFVSTESSYASGLSAIFCTQNKMDKWSSGQGLEMLISSQEAHMCAYTECTHHKQHQPSPAFYPTCTLVSAHSTHLDWQIFLYTHLDALFQPFGPAWKMQPDQKHLVT